MITTPLVFFFFLFQMPEEVCMKREVVLIGLVYFRLNYNTCNVSEV